MLQCLCACFYGERILKVRVKFDKGEKLKLISHLNLIKAFVQALRRSDLPVAYSAGFSPHPKVSFGPPLPLGMKSRSEFADIVLEKIVDVYKLKVDFNKKLPEGLKILEVREICPQSKSLMAIIDVATYEIRLNGRKAPLNISLKFKERVKVKEAVKSLLKEEGLDLISVDVERTGLFVEREGSLISPMEA